VDTDLLVHYNVFVLFQGDPLPDVVWPQHPVAQVTALAWHPTKKLLVTGWENGELQAWAGDAEFVSVQSVHQAPITVLQWSTLGGRLVSGDTVCTAIHSKVLRCFTMTVSQGAIVCFIVIVTFIPVVLITVVICISIVIVVIPIVIDISVVTVIVIPINSYCYCYCNSRHYYSYCCCYSQCIPVVILILISLVIVIPIHILIPIVPVAIILFIDILIVIAIAIVFLILVVFINVIFKKDYISLADIL
jgi:hypothetical protein